MLYNSVPGHEEVTWLNHYGHTVPLAFQKSKLFLMIGFTVLVTILIDRGTPRWFPSTTGENSVPAENFPVSFPLDRKTCKCLSALHRHWTVLDTAAHC
jgi:hypothetical protein